MIMNAFTCTGSYAILILYGIKRTENRSAWPEPREGRAAISCSKSFCKEEYGQFIAWASVNLPPEDLEKLPAWREVKDWPGKVVGVCDYKASHQPINQQTNQPYLGTRVIRIGGTCRTSCVCPSRFPAAAMSECGIYQNLSRQTSTRSITHLNFKDMVCKLWTCRYDVW